jgi:hypothetical protein
LRLFPIVAAAAADGLSIIRLARLVVGDLMPAAAGRAVSAAVEVSPPRAARAVVLAAGPRRVAARRGRYDVTLLQARFAAWGPAAEDFATKLRR